MFSNIKNKLIIKMYLTEVNESCGSVHAKNPFSCDCGATFEVSAYNTLLYSVMYL